jgi:LPS transport system D
MTPTQFGRVVERVDAAALWCGARGWRRVLTARAGLAIGVLAGVCAESAPGQVAGEKPQRTEAAAARPIDPASIDGRTFGGLTLPLEARRGTLTFSSRQAYAWREGDTQRLLLKEGVRVRIDTVEFESERAMVWLERVRVLPGGGNEYQVYLYLDKARTPSQAAFDAPPLILVEGERLPVRGVVIVEGEPTLKVDEVLDGRPSSQGDEGEFVRAGEAQLAGSLRRLIPGYVERAADPFEGLPSPAPVQRLGVEAGADQAPKGPTFDPVVEASRVFEDSPVARAPEPIFAKSGVITLSAGKVTLVTSETENTVMATEGVVIEYTDLRRGERRTLQVRAQRAVLFLAGTQSDLSRFSAKDVVGFYLEGDASATDGAYTLRGPKMYYDMARNKAVVLDAVFWTYDTRRQLPLYVRARTIRQESNDQFRAERARFSNSAFFEPEFSIGATSVTVSRRVADPTQEEGLEGRGGVERTHLEARNITLRAGDIPFFYWPGYSGDPADQPLRDVRLENQAGSGTTLRTRWAMYQLLGLRGPENTSLDLQVDASTLRGAGLGSTLAWDRPTAKGDVSVYGLPDDRGQDVLKSGARIGRDGDFRGIIAGEDRRKLADRWTAFTEGAYISDETFVEAMLPRMASERREFVSRFVARRLEENAAVFVEASGSLNDFVANEYLLTSRGYSTSKLPEATYLVQAEDLVPGNPGLVTYWSEYRAGRLSLNFDEIVSGNRGLTSDGLSQRALGIDANQSPADRLRALGLNEDGVFRADTRHEVTMQVNAGAVNVQPFVVGRVTMYDSDFAGYSANGGNDDARLWGAAGVRLSTSIQRVWDGVDSRILDIHRLRHIVEPGITYMASGTNVESSDLPVFDDEIENLIDGQVVRFGVDQTWQTQRGGPGRWHGVDVFKLKTEVVLSSDDVPVKGPIGRWYEPRPELSWAGNYFSAEGTWQVTDTFAVTGRDVYDFDLGQQALTGGGLLIRHSPEFSSYADAHYVNSQDQTIVGIGAQYQLTEKYLLSTGATFDAGENGFQGATIEFRRRFESVTLGTSITYDEISGTASFGFSIQPAGARGSASLGGFGGSSTVSRVGG